MIGRLSEAKSDAKINLEILEKLTYQSLFPFRRIDIEICSNLDEWNSFLEEPAFIEPIVVIDCLFGTGLDRPLSGIYESIISCFEIWRSYDNKTIISLDVPSGLDADSAEQIGKNIWADSTVTFTAPKLANIFPPASNFNGELVVANIGSPQDLVDNSPSQTFVGEKQDAQDWLNKTKVKAASYKKNRGTALIIAGSKNYTGAAVLAANACFAAGAGMVSLGVPQSIQEIVAAKVLEEIITRGFAETKNGAFAKTAAKDVLEASAKVNVVALGCGLTSDETSTKNFVREVVTKRRTPIVIDADGLNALAPLDLQGSEELPLILTPHIGEFQTLAGKKEITDKIASAREFAEKHNVVLLLKGERSLIAAPDGRVVINPTGNAGIARAGAGDTLTGIVTAFLAQTYGTEKPSLENTFQTVITALYIAGLAGDIAAEKFGERLMSATDVRDCLGEAIASITN